MATHVDTGYARPRAYSTPHDGADVMPKGAGHIVFLNFVFKTARMHRCHNNSLRRRTNWDAEVEESTLCLFVTGVLHKEVIRGQTICSKSSQCNAHPPGCQEC